MAGKRKGAPRLADILIARHQRDWSACWDWPWTQDGRGYGSMWFNGRPGRKAYRVLYEILVGPVPEGMQLDHLCRNRLCCNPQHLEPVTQAENIRRGGGISVRNAAKERCPRGHEYDRFNERGWRNCSTCHNERRRVKREVA